MKFFHSFIRTYIHTVCCQSWNMYYS